MQKRLKSPEETGNFKKAKLEEWKRKKRMKKKCMWGGQQQKVTKSQQ